jgi:hypothetical protein
MKRGSLLQCGCRRRNRWWIAQIPPRVPWSWPDPAHRSVLAQVPHAAAWSSRFTSAGPTAVTSAKRFRQQAAPTIVRNAAQGIAQACVPDPDGMLRDLLVQAIATCAAWAGHDPNRGAALDPALWAAACRRTGGFPVADATMPDALAHH